MNRNIQKATASVALFLLAVTLLVAALSPAVAQTTDDVATVIILPSAGGTTEPVPGNYTYQSNETINLAAIPNEGFEFRYWIVSGSLTPGHTASSGGFYTDPETGAIIQLPNPANTQVIDSLVFDVNPANITCGYGYTYTYQAVFAPSEATSTSPPPQTEPATSTSVGVTILESVGGVTDPAPGTYSYENGTDYTLSATADNGYVFHYWIVYGTYQPSHTAQPNYIPGVNERYPIVPENIYQPTVDSLVFSINPVTITCGYGYNYTYQAIFDPVNASVTPIPTTTPAATSTMELTQSPGETSTPTLDATGSPNPAVTPSPEVTPTPEDTILGLSTTLFILIVVVVVIIIIIAVAAVLMRRGT
ncbi:MAG: hypothetical protein NWF00_04240 [Candidatus Bathyarchaeota archaeon]|nr:hypothetical protein [Candidatus Bathyarchaeota archaeon]